MNRAPRSHDDLAELLGAYALDAVDDDERVEVEDHLRDCPRCRSEVADHREVAAQLAFTGATAPEGLWTRIAAELEPAAPEPELGHLYPLRPRTGRSRAMQALVAVAAALILVVGGLGWEVHAQQRRIDRVSRAVGPTSLQNLMALATDDPRSARYDLRSANGAINVNVVIAPDGTGYLASNGTLPALPAGRTYQLWGISGTTAISLGLLGVKPGIAVFPASVAGLSALAITAERSGGAVQPSAAPLAVGDVLST